MRHSGVVDAAQIEAEKNELLRVLDELADLLRTWDEVEWAERMDRDRRLIADGHPDALDHLLLAFGGMGGFGDLIIDAAHGHAIADDRVRRVNDRLRVLRGAVFAKSTILRDAAAAS